MRWKSRETSGNSEKVHSLFSVLTSADHSSSNSSASRLGKKTGKGKYSIAQEESFSNSLGILLRRGKNEHGRRRRRRRLRRRSFVRVPLPSPCLPPPPLCVSLSSVFIFPFPSFLSSPPPLPSFLLIFPPTAWAPAVNALHTVQYAGRKWFLAPLRASSVALSRKEGKKRGRIFLPFHPGHMVSWRKG